MINDDDQKETADEGEISDDVLDALNDEGDSEEDEDEEDKEEDEGGMFGFDGTHEEDRGGW